MSATLPLLISVFIADVAFVFVYETELFFKYKGFARSLDISKLLYLNLYSEKAANFRRDLGQSVGHFIATAIVLFNLQYITNYTSLNATTFVTKQKNPANYIRFETKVLSKNFSNIENQLFFLKM